VYTVCNGPASVHLSVSLSVDSSKGTLQVEDID